MANLPLLRKLITNTTRIHTNTHTDTRTKIHTQTHTHTNTNIHRQTHTHTQTHTQTHTHKHTHTNTHTQTHTNTHTHTHDRTLLNEWSSRRRGLYLHNTQLTQENNIHVLSGIRTRDPSRLKPYTARPPRPAYECPTWHGHFELCCQLQRSIRKRALQACHVEWEGNCYKFDPPNHTLWGYCSCHCWPWTGFNTVNGNSCVR